MKQLLGMPQWFRVAARNFLISGIAAYLACEAAVWYFQPTYRWPVFLAMPILWWFGFWVMASSGRAFAGLTLRNIVTFARDERHRHLVLKFRRRAIWARVGARCQLAAMAACIAGMGWLFVYAGALVQGDAAYSLGAALDRLEAALPAVESIDASAALTLAPEEQQALEQWRAALSTPAPVPGQESAPAPAAEAQDLSLLGAKLDAYLAARASLLEADAAVTALRTELAAAREAAASVEGGDGYSQFMAVQGARFGGMAALFVLLLALIQFYRYNTRLAAHYDARADVIELVQSDDIEKLVKGVEMFSPDVLDFGKSHTPSPVPRAPAGQVLRGELQPPA
ncbi:MAG: hypothetical protein RLZZ303_1352 [Candidatus Hydrogenedentota bacterium]|jgi:hypothetical protein